MCQQLNYKCLNSISSNAAFRKALPQLAYLKAELVEIFRCDKSSGSVAERELQKLVLLIEVADAWELMRKQSVVYNTSCIRELPADERLSETEL